MTSPCHCYLRKGGGEGKEIRLGKVEPNRCSFRKVLIFGLQQNKQTTELEWEPNCSIVLQLAVFPSCDDIAMNFRHFQRVSRTCIGCEERTT
jgi:hypothetical protein